MFDTFWLNWHKSSFAMRLRSRRGKIGHLCVLND